MSTDTWLSYHFAVLRAVPHVHRGEFVNVGVVLHARTAELIVMQAIADASVLRAKLPGMDTELLMRYLSALRGICEGRADAGPIAMLPSSERFHWIVSPRSDMIQCSPVHEGICADPLATLKELYAEMVDIE